jgi:hypothetical protein
MILDNTFLPGSLETSFEELTRLRSGLALLRNFHRNAVTGLDYMRSLDPNLVSGLLVRILAIDIQMELKEPLGLGADFKSEHAALKRSVSELHKRLSVARLAALAADDGDLTMEAFRKVDGALLSPISSWITC